MAGFNINRFGNWGSTMNKFAPQAHLYKSTTDAMATIIVDGYFNDRVGGLEIEDILYIAATDKVGLFKVTAVSPNVTIAVIDLEGAGLEQAQIYYWGDNGLATNNGKSDQSPFATPIQAAAAILAQTPGPTNRFEIQTIGAPVFEGDLPVPTYTTLQMGSGKFIGTITPGDESKIICDELTAPASETAIAMDGAITAYLKANIINGNTSSIGFILENGAVLHTDIGELDLTGAGSKGSAIDTNSILYLKADTFNEDTASTQAGGAKIIEVVNRKGGTNDTHLKNDAGSHILTSSAGEVFRNLTIYPKWTNTPLLETRMSGIGPDLTGAGVGIAAVKFDDVKKDIGGLYNPLTGVVTLPNLQAYYWIVCGITLGHLAAAHNGLIAYMNISPGIVRNLDIGDPGAARHKATNEYHFGGSTLIYLLASTTFVIDVTVAGGTQVVDILTNSYLNVYMAGAV